MGSKRYLSPREILGDRRRDRHLTAAEILSDELEGESASDDDLAGGEGTRRAGRNAETVDTVRDRRETPGTDWQWLDDRSVESRDD